MLKNIGTAVVLNNINQTTVPHNAVDSFVSQLVSR